MSKRKLERTSSAVENLPDLKAIFAQQKESLSQFFDKLDYDEVSKLTQKLLKCKGSVLFTGVGKSGFVAKKINQTLVSTGTRALWLAPVDALHGDIGLVSPGDILVMFSKSGTTKELLTLVPYAKAKGGYIVVLTSNHKSPLAQVSDMVVSLPLEKELQAFPNEGLGQSREAPPATSNTVQMLFGDTIAVALMNARGLTQNQYAMNHPAGRIGKRLVMKVHDVMQPIGKLAKCIPSDNGLAALTRLSQNPSAGGCLMVSDQSGELKGTLQDGDLRRALTLHGKAVLEMSVQELMNFNKTFPRTCGADMMAADAVLEMEKHKVTYLPVVDDTKMLLGVITVKDLAAAGL